VNSDSLPIRQIAASIGEADQQIYSSMTGSRVMLKTQWDLLNRYLLGGFEFGQTYMLCGASGHGKSYMLNNLLQDFINPRTQQHSCKVLHFCFEMSASVEILRRISSSTRIGYRDLLSADKPLDPEQYSQIKQHLDKVKTEPIYFCETPGTRIDIYNTIKKMKERFPDDNLVVTLDHVLLVQPLPGENEVQTLAELGKMFIQIRKEFGTMNILLCQLNDKIESSIRRDPGAASLHFPTKTDIHGSKQLYHATDVCLVVHQPALLGLEVYGKHHVPTITENGRNLVALHILKNRHGTQGYVRLISHLDEGRILEWQDNRITT
jgi:replicative DNA helicase